jgi:hypothetical protein
MASSSNLRCRVRGFTFTMGLLLSKPYVVFYHTAPCSCMKFLRHRLQTPVDCNDKAVCNRFVVESQRHTRPIAGLSPFWGMPPATDLQSLVREWEGEIEDNLAMVTVNQLRFHNNRLQTRFAIHFAIAIGLSSHCAAPHLPAQPARSIRRWEDSASPGRSGPR